MEIPTGFMETRAHGFYIVTRPVYLKIALDVASRDPETILAGAAQPGAMEGRGPRVELPGEGGESIILKKQLRGGLYRKFRGDTYRSDYHAILEVVVSERAWKKGVPVGQLAFAMAAPEGPGRLASYRRAYSAAIKVPGALNMMERLSSTSSVPERRAVLTAAAEGIRRAHDRGMEHGDLNLGNILITKSGRGEHGALLIDNGRSELGRVLLFRPRLRNLVRLYRSAQKWLPDPDPRRRSREVVLFLRAYANRERGEVRKYLEAAGRYRASLFMHRLAWRTGRTRTLTPRSSAREGR
ncbi:MAG TPA: lipopolysaccharide kinase InaA family protein [Candidatus Polarisedimenticolia bacterium]